MMQDQEKTTLRRDDWVQVRSAAEIIETLDAQGSVAGLPFMPEMAELCGRCFRILRHAAQICIDGASLSPDDWALREFHNNDVFVLEGVRCSGAVHGGCQRACTFMWKRAWLRRCSPDALSEAPVPSQLDALKARLKSMSGPGVYYCQSSEMIRATHHLSRRRRLGKCMEQVWRGSYSLCKMIRFLSVWFFWRVHRLLMGEYPRGNLQATPGESLNLQPGEWVEVRPLPEIIQTLDRQGKNQGLHFSTDMRVFCGRRLRVQARADRLIIEGLGTLRQMRNTVILEGALCDSAYFAFGGCSRDDVMYWREIWLRRVNPCDNTSRHAV